MKEINIDNKNENIQKENELIISKTFKKEKDFSGNLYSREKNLTFNIKDIQKDRQNIIKIENSDLEFVDINENFTKKPNTAPFDDICSMCSSKIYFKKYIYIFCCDCVLCQDCQEEHLHPIIKCKQT